MQPNTKSPSLTQKVRQLFVIHQIMYCIDSRAASPFHILNADLIDCYGGSAELLRIFNRIGICVSQDTLQRYVQSTVSKRNQKGLLQGLNPDGITIFSMDNIDFMHKYARAFSGNQKGLSWHGTTIQAIQTKPSLDLYPMVGQKRSHALLSPPGSPHVQEQQAKRIRSRARTGTEFASGSTTSIRPSPSYEFHPVSAPSGSSDEPVVSISITDFRASNKETDLLFSRALTYCLIKNALPAEEQKELLGFQEFLGITTNAPTPEIGYVRYSQVLDEVADCKDTVLGIVSRLHSEYMLMHNHSFVVLEGDAKVYDIIQRVKREYGSDLDWLIPFPGDWHLLKNYQICLMKPFFEAGLRDLATASGYPAKSIENCSKFRRTHHFLMETWEGLLRHMLATFLSSSSTTLDIAGTLRELHRHHTDKLAAYSVIRAFQEEMAESAIETSFRQYIKERSKIDDTWKFWSRFVLEDFLPYVGLFIAVRSENWPLRLDSIKSMAADFTAFDHPTYQKLISQHVVDLQSFPSLLMQYMENGGFALSISGNIIHSVGLDECHEMLINRHMKEAISKPSQDYISRVATYIPARVKCIEQLKSEIFEDKTTQPSRRSAQATKSAVFLGDPSDSKSEANVQSQMDKLAQVKLLPHNITTNRGLVNPFRNLTASTAQREDLLSFHQLGKKLFENRVKAYVLKQASVQVPQKRKALLTFATKPKRNRRHLTSLERELKTVQRCMRLKIANAIRNGTTADVRGEQYLELPRALCDIDGLPTKGQKSLVTNFYQCRYKESSIITHQFPPNWIADSVIIDGMFLINCSPLGSHKTMADYGNFLLKRFITPHLRKGSKEIHLLFDEPGQQEENPKSFEQARRELPPSDHQCMVFCEDAEVPSYWRKTISCRKCKRSLTVFLSSYTACFVKKSLQGGQKFVTAGATEKAGGLEVTVGPGVCGELQFREQQSDTFKCNSNEADSRIWLHAAHCAGPNIFIVSPDTDVYHIGLPLETESQRILVQVSKLDKDLKLLDLTILIDALKRDPALVGLAEEHIPQIMQTLFAATGCDYVSFFAGIGKSTFLKVFFEYVTFIMGDKTPPPFSTMVTSDNMKQEAQDSVLAFIRLVGCAYFKKHLNAFFGKTPESTFNTFADAASIRDQHINWLDSIRQGIWDRISQESETIPSFAALELHWQRSCWVVHMWQQATSNDAVLAKLDGHGWVKGDGGSLEILWDSETNRKKVKERVLRLLKGCTCKSGCSNKRCGCRRRGDSCGPGCRCIDCANLASSTPEKRDQDNAQ